MQGGSDGLRGVVNSGWPAFVATSVQAADAYIPVVFIVQWSFILAGGWVVVAVIRVLKSFVPTVA